jgi:hypothetical protein
MVVFKMPSGGGFLGQVRRMGQQKDVILKNKPEKLLILNTNRQKQTQTNPKQSGEIIENT